MRQRTRQIKPIIPGSKEKGKKKSKRFFSLDISEKQFLFGKKIKQGKSKEQADKEIRNTCQTMKEKYQKLIKKGVPEKEAEMKVKEEMARELYE